MHQDRAERAAGTAASGMWTPGGTCTSEPAPEVKMTQTVTDERPTSSTRVMTAPRRSWRQGNSTQQERNGTE